MSTIITGILSFVATNLDDLFLVMLLFSVGSSLKKKDIVIGQYIGLIALLLVSILIVNGLKSFPQKYIGILGLIPIFLGVRTIWDSYKEDKEKKENKGNSKSQKSKNSLSKMGKFPIISIALITIASGADNIGVYVPIFSQESSSQISLNVIVFILMIGIWCFLGDKFANIPAVKNVLNKYGHIFIPLTLIGLGIYIIVSSGLL
ncbi:hypothetical protein BG261_05200 [Floricoccus tropicus]|uniref:Cadmium transporter n=1 Tax=Floricoccus tropicus TaxID=1859473 RepID=A0A1E8GLD9_9LACT|nr:cadmium resistance transporter [Floricoccus tropicus]OFI48786.1 hypothetical protein BG261_05200 [Floricoccus tropicus]